jgi:hypothetical protein
MRKTPSRWLRLEQFCGSAFSSSSLRRTMTAGSMDQRVSDQAAQRRLSFVVCSRSLLFLGSLEPQMKRPKR